MNRHKNLNYASTVDKESIVYEYFRLIKKKDIYALLNLFADDAVVYEPFSNIDGGLKGRYSIKNFLNVVIMANEGMRYEIEFIKASESKEEDDEIIALVTFEREEKV